MYFSHQPPPFPLAPDATARVTSSESRNSSKFELSTLFFLFSFYSPRHPYSTNGFFVAKATLMNAPGTLVRCYST
ncbi:hypothetical protein PM082_015583 [Marasmius tenuissimus]|nr:hypothetical protein PM082_015583 [Marasmius tenuissimus]